MDSPKIPSDVSSHAKPHGEAAREVFNQEAQQEKAKIMDWDCFMRAKKRGQ